MLYATFWRRVIASLIDWSVIDLSSLITLGVLFERIALLLFVFIPWLYFSTMESSGRQATLGKIALGIIVTDTAGRRFSFGRATSRYFAKTLSVMTGGIGFMMALSPKKTALHDVITDCLVLSKLDRTGRAWQSPSPDRVIVVRFWSRWMIGLGILILALNSLRARDPEIWWIAHPMMNIIYTTHVVALGFLLIGRGIKGREEYVVLPQATPDDRVLMDCPKCGLQNPGRSNFCTGCGTGFFTPPAIERKAEVEVRGAPRDCPKCGLVNVPWAENCDCGYRFPSR